MCDPLDGYELTLKTLGTTLPVHKSYAQQMKRTINYPNDLLAMECTPINILTKS